MATCAFSRTVFSGVLLCFALVLAGCGYGFQGGGTILPENIRKVYISRVVNKTTEPNLTQLVAEALSDEFGRYGVIEVVDSLGDADAELIIQVNQIRKSTRASTSVTDVALQQDLSVTASGTLSECRSGKNAGGGNKTGGSQIGGGQILWRDQAITVIRPFGVSAGSVITSSADFATGNIGAQDLAGLSVREISRGQEQQALEDIATILARRIYTDSVSPDF